MYYKGHNIVSISDILCIPTGSVSNYINVYESTGKDNNLPRGGRSEQLNSSQSSDLSNHLEEKTYLKVSDIILHVANRYGVVCRASGMKV